MLIKPLTLAMLMACAQNASADSTWSYEFSGNFDDHFTQISDVGTAVAIQSDGRFIYSVDSLDTAGDGPLLVHNQFMPTFGQFWAARIEATIPSALDALPNVKDWYMEAGIAVGFKTTSSGFSLSHALEIGNMANLAGTTPARKYLSEYYVDDQDVWDKLPQGDPTHITSRETVALWIVYDNHSKMLSLLNEYGNLASVDASDWGMRNTDPFQITPFFSVEGYGIPADTPLAFDNFTSYIRAEPVGTVVPNFLGNSSAGILASEHVTYSAEGIDQAVSAGVLGRPSFMVPGDYLQVFHVSMSGTQNGLIELSFVYDPTLLPGGFDEGNLRVFHWTGNEWENLGGVVDAANNTITVTTNSLSPFAIAAVPEPETYALMLVGLGLVGFAVQARFRK
jgi:hypothetical protein